MSDAESLQKELDRVQYQLRVVTESLVSVSEANGCSLDAMLALLPSLQAHGLLLKGEDGKSPFMEALKAQHAQLYYLNQNIVKLMDEVGLDSSSVPLSPSPADKGK